MRWAMDEWCSIRIRSKSAGSQYDELAAPASRQISILAGRIFNQRHNINCEAVHGYSIASWQAQLTMFIIRSTCGLTKALRDSNSFYAYVLLE